MDMPIAFYTLNGNLPLAKFSAHGFSLGSFHCYEITLVIDMREQA